MQSIFELVSTNFLLLEKHSKVENTHLLFVCVSVCVFVCLSFIL